MNEKYTELIQQRINPNFLTNEFPEEHFGVADKSLLRKIVNKNIESFFVSCHPLERDYAASSFCCDMAILVEMKTWGYKAGIEKYLPRFRTFYNRKKLDGD